MGNLLRFGCQNWLKSMAKFLSVPTNSSCSPLKNIGGDQTKTSSRPQMSCFHLKTSGEKQKKGLHALRYPAKKSLRAILLFSHTSAAAFPLTRFSGLACVPEKGSSSRAKFGTRARCCLYLSLLTGKIHYPQVLIQIEFLNKDLRMRGRPN